MKVNHIMHFEFMTLYYHCGFVSFLFRILCGFEFGSGFGFGFGIGSVWHNGFRSVWQLRN